jgi:hypothetical protein
LPEISVFFFEAFTGRARRVLLQRYLRDAGRQFDEFLARFGYLKRIILGD